jgi:hypothetical protein
MTRRLSSARTFAALAALFGALTAATLAHADHVKGPFTANGQSAALTHAVAVEVDSKTEPGYMDVIVVLSNRAVRPADAQDLDRLERMAREDGLAALVVRIDPDAKVMSATPLHAAFKTVVQSAAFIRWQPSAFDEQKIAGRFWTDGTQKAFGQAWSYDLTFTAPITLDPAAATVPKP